MISINMMQSFKDSYTLKANVSETILSFSSYSGLFFCLITELWLVLTLIK